MGDMTPAKHSVIVCRSTHGRPMTIAVDPTLKFQRLSRNAAARWPAHTICKRVAWDMATDSLNGRGEILLGNDYIDALPSAKDWSASKLMTCPFSSISLPMVNVSW